MSTGHGPRYWVHSRACKEKLVRPVIHPDHHHHHHTHTHTYPSLPHPYPTLPCPYPTLPHHTPRHFECWALSRIKTFATPSPHEDTWRQTSNRCHISSPVIRSRDGLGGADLVDDHLVFASEPSAQRELPFLLHLIEAVPHVLKLLAACGRVVP